MDDFKFYVIYDPVRNSYITCDGEWCDDLNYIGVLVLEVDSLNDQLYNNMRINFKYEVSFEIASLKTFYMVPFYIFGLDDVVAAHDHPLVKKFNNG